MAAKFLLSALCLLLTNEISAGKKLIVLSIDGLRWDYITDPKLELKGIWKIIENGVRAQYVNPVYPTLSYPNWYSIVTGLYPESHGIVSNIMYDNETGKSCVMMPGRGSTDPHWWNRAEPIWVTAEKEGKNAAMYWWAGCEVEIRGVHPMICERHRYGPGTEDEKADYFERIDDIMEMFKPSHVDRLSLVLMYYGAVDYAGHYFGPRTSETRRALLDIDEILLRMIKEVEKAGLQEEVSIMVVSGHGMTDVRQRTTQYIDLEKFATSIKYQVSYGSTTMLVAQDGTTDELYTDLKEAKINGITVYKKEEIPDWYHLKNSSMVGDIFIKAEKGYYLKALNDSTKRIGKYPDQYYGDHGYDPDEVDDMRTIFFVSGPGFRKGHVSKPMSNVDLYNMMCYALHIDPLPNNGSVEILKEVLDNQDEFHLVSNSASILMQSISFSLFFFVYLFLCFSFKYH